MNSLKGNIKPYKVHVDVDNTHVYGDLYQNPMFLSKNIYDQAFSTMLKILNEKNIKALIFVVGKDLQDENNVNEVMEAFKQGHIIGNHSMTHRRDFKSLDKKNKIEEIMNADKIFRAIGVDCVHYKAPGYAFDPEIIKDLRNLNYEFECSRMPAIYTTLLDIYYKINRITEKQFPSLLRPQDYRIFFGNLKKTITEENIHNARFFGFPNYSTSIFLKIKNLKSKENIKFRIAQNNPFLFHAVDFMDYYDSNSKIPALQIPFENRLQVIDAILNAKIKNKKEVKLTIK